MNVTNIDHIGIAVRNLKESIKWYEEALGLKCAGTETVAEQKVVVAFMPCGDGELELLEPIDETSAVARFMEKNGEGVQHIALRVNDVEAALNELKAKGVRLIDETPRRGAGGAEIAFIRPKSAGGVLIELCERK